MPAHHRQDYGHRHQQRRRAWRPQVATGTIHCWRCDQPITPDQGWDLGHRPDGLPPHPEHITCNRSAGAAYGNRLREPRSPGIW